MAREPGAAVAEPSARRFPQSEQRSLPKGTAGGTESRRGRGGARALGPSASLWGRGEWLPRCHPGLRRNRLGDSRDPAKGALLFPSYGDVTGQTMQAGPWSESRGIHGDGPPSPVPVGLAPAGSPALYFWAGKLTLTEHHPLKTDQSHCPHPSWTWL